jgi:hypothetical protein
VLRKLTLQGAAPALLTHLRAHELTTSVRWNTCRQLFVIEAGHRDASSAPERSALERVTILA